MGIRDRLRAWQKQHEKDPETSTPHGFPVSMSGSQQNLLGQAGTSDTIDCFLEDDDPSQNELASTLNADDQIVDAGDSEIYLRKGDLVELL